MKHKESVKTSGALKALGAEGGLEFEQNLTASGEKDHKETNKTGTYTVKKTELYDISVPSMTSAGTKTVTVSYSGISTSYSIQVADLWISLSCDTSGANSGYITFSASVPCGYVNWSSSDTGVASVNSSGVATFGSTMGTTTITATVNNNGCTQSASGTLTLSNYSGTKYKETSSTSYSNVLYGSHPDGYDTAHPVTGSIPSYTTNAADVSCQYTNTSTGRVDTFFSQT